MTWIIIISIVILIFIYILVQYNGFVKLTNMVEEAFSTMDVYLKKRWDLIPNLVEAVKGYAKHEDSKHYNWQIPSITASYEGSPYS